jgi:hypothetical protein
MGEKARATGAATRDGAKTVSDATVDTSQKAAASAKKGATATADGAKRFGLRIKDAVTPDKKPAKQ